MKFKRLIFMVLMVLIILLPVAHAKEDLSQYLHYTMLENGDILIINDYNKYLNSDITFITKGYNDTVMSKVTLNKIIEKNGTKIVHIDEYNPTETKLEIIFTNTNVTNDPNISIVTLAILILICFIIIIPLYSNNKSQS